MSKKIAILIFGILISFTSFSQNFKKINLGKEDFKIDDLIKDTNDKRRFSNFNKTVRDYKIEKEKSSKNDSSFNKFKEQNSFKTIKNIDYVTCIIGLTDLAYVDSLSKYKIKVIRRAIEKSVFALIIIDNIDSIINLPFITKIQLGSRVEKQDILSRSLTKSDSLQKGIQLPLKYSGKGVVVGIIDDGFDLTHPNFYDSLGKEYRIKRVWNQKDTDTTGTPPPGFQFGNEYTTQSQMISKRATDSSESHGTHVTGIASGSGYGNTDSLKGISNQSDLVLVQTTFSTFDINLGIQYILDYAKSVNKPCVINMSLGSHFGPHDGTSLFDRLLDSRYNFGNENGALIVGAAGNEGLKNIHSKLKLNADTLFNFIKPWPVGTNKVSNNIATSLYGELGKDLKVFFGIYNRGTNKFEALTPFYDINQSKSIDTFLTVSSQKISLQIYFDKDDITQQKSIRYFIEGQTYQNLFNNNTNRIFVVGYTSKSNTVNTWIYSPSDGPAFLNNTLYSSVIDGDNLSTVGEIGGTGKSIISVGSYNSNLMGLKSFSGDTLYKRSSFSSIGNTVDNRIKPDVIAPGQFIFSSFNKWDKTVNLNSTTLKSILFNGIKYPYEYSQGTSMAAPLVAGVLGTWLEASPLLTLNQAKEIIRNSSISDTNTKSLPNSFYGYGKIDAYNGIKLLLSYMPPKPKFLIKTDTAVCLGDSLILNAPAGQKSYFWYNGLTKLSSTTNSLIVKTPGNYFYAVQGTNGYWSNYSDTLKLTVNQLPTAPAVTNIFTYCQGANAVALNANVTSGNTLLWFGTNSTGGSGVSVPTTPSTSNTGVFNYYVTQKNSTTGCISPRTSISVTINPIPTIPIITRDTANYLVSTALKNVWYKDGQVLSDSSQRVKYTPPGQFTVKAVQNGCVSALSSPYYLVTDIINISKDEFIKVAPNPFKNLLNLDFVIKGYQRLNLEVFDMASGTKVSSKPNLTPGISIYLDQLSAGTYIIRISSNDGKINYQFKMIKI